MKEIKAIIQPFMLQHVCDALEKIEGLPGLTVSQVLGWGKARGQGARDPVQEAGHAFAKKTKVELVVTDEMAVLVVAAIQAAAKTGQAGDGKIFIIEVGDAMRIRTGERGTAAL